MADSKHIDALMDGLPAGGLTVHTLELLEHLLPGQWQNTTGFDNAIRQFSGESDPDITSRIRARALQLYSDPANGYERAVSLYQTVDTVDEAVGAAVLAHEAGEKFSFLGFLDRVTPQPEKAQATDLALKLVAEGICFCQINGLPGDGIGDFAAAVESYEQENLVRIAAILVFNGLIPLGPDFVSKMMETVRNLQAPDLEDNRFFRLIREHLPGGGAGDALSFVRNGVESLESFAGGVLEKHGITLDNVLGELRGVIQFSEDKLETLAAFADMSLNYMTHTGIQSASRVLIQRAAGEI